MNRSGGLRSATIAGPWRNHSFSRASFLSFLMNGAYKVFAEAVLNLSTGFDIILGKGGPQNLFPLICFVMILCR